MKEAYVKPEIDLVVPECADILTLSNENSDENATPIVPF